MKTRICIFTLISLSAFILLSCGNKTDSENTNKITFQEASESACNSNDGDTILLNFTFGMTSLEYTTYMFDLLSQEKIQSVDGHSFVYILKSEHYNNHMLCTPNFYKDTLYFLGCNAIESKSTKTYKHNIGINHDLKKLYQEKYGDVMGETMFIDKKNSEFHDVYAWFNGHTKITFCDFRPDYDIICIEYTDVRFSKWMQEDKKNKNNKKKKQQKTVNNETVNDI